MDDAGSAQGETSSVDGATVAVVDDDPAVLKAVGRLVRSAGFRTLLFSDPLRALRTLRPASASVVVTDRSMPGCTGPELVSRLREAGLEGARFILLTGDPTGLRTDELSLFEAIVPKDASPRRLLEALRDALP